MRLQIAGKNFPALYRLKSLIDRHVVGPAWAYGEVESRPAPADAAHTLAILEIVRQRFASLNSIVFGLLEEETVLRHADFVAADQLRVAFAEAEHAVEQAHKTALDFAGSTGAYELEAIASRAIEDAPAKPPSRVPITITNVLLFAMEIDALAERFKLYRARGGPGVGDAGSVDAVDNMLDSAAAEVRTNLMAEFFGVPMTSATINQTRILVGSKQAIAIAKGGGK